MEESKKYKLALKRVKQKKGFYRHLSVYIVICTFLFIINYLSTPGDWWFFYPVAGWGVGVALNYVAIFGITGAGLGAPDWEERQLEKEMNRLGLSNSPDPLLEVPAKDDKLDLDEHLQLKPVKRDKTKVENYSNEDFV